MGYAIYGRGGFGREIAPLALEQAAREEGDVVFVDDTTDGQTECNGLPLLDFNELCMPAHRDRVIIVAIGDGKIRKKIEDKCRTAGLQMGILFAPTARMVGPSTFGEGTVLCDHSYITANARIGLSFQCNAFSYVAHDCVLGDYVSFAPRVSCNGNVHIGDFAYIGTGALIKQGTSSVPLTIGESAIVGMGAVVTKNVDPYTVVVGNPARVLRKQEQ